MNQDTVNLKCISALFLLSTIYDGALGLAFLMAPNQIFGYFQVPPPNHMGYVQFPALLLLIFALIFYQIARQPLEKKDLIIYGILLKVSYCVVTAGYWVQSMLPDMWKPFTICDAIMGVLYIFALAKLSTPTKAVEQ